MPAHEHESERALSDAQIQQFNREGFVRIDRAFPRSLAAEGREPLLVVGAMAGGRQLQPAIALFGTSIRVATHRIPAGTCVSRADYAQRSSARSRSNR